MHDILSCCNAFLLRKGAIVVAKMIWCVDGKVAQGTG